jgi:hypothetical protein
MRAREEGAVPALVALLASPDARVQNRAVGALHNLSSEPKAIRGIRRRGGIPLLVALLGSPTLHAAGSAAGTLQNISREVASRLIIRWAADGSVVRPFLATVCAIEGRVSCSRSASQRRALGWSLQWHWQGLHLVWRCQVRTSAAVFMSIGGFET